MKNVAQWLDLIQGDPEVYPLRNRVLNAIVLSSVLISLGLEVAAIVIGHPWFVHVTLIVAAMFYVGFYFFSRRDPRQVNSRAWIWVAWHALIILIDWFFISGSRGICLPIAVCVIVITPTLLRGYKAAIGVGAMLAMLLMMMVVDMNPGWVSFRSIMSYDLMADGPGVIVDRFVSVIILAVGVCGIEVLIISSHDRQKKRIKVLNTKLQKLNEDITQDNLKLKELNHMKDSFFNILAHDLRNPIGGLSSLSTMLSQKYEGFTDEEQKELIELMSQSSNSALQLLNNLLIWARAESGLMKAVPVRIDVKDCIDACFQLLELLAREKSIQLLNQCSPDYCVRGDEEMVNLIFRNLLSNAVKFTEVGGVVTVMANREEDMLEVQVKDSGVGMTKEELRSVLASKNVSKPGTAKEKGTGLGLKLVREFIQLNGGDLTISSEPGVGSCFTVKLPVF